MILSKKYITLLKTIINNYPKYYLVDFDIFIKLYIEGDEVVGINSFGNPYPVGNALAEGVEITEQEFQEKNSNRF